MTTTEKVEHKKHRLWALISFAILLIISIFVSIGFGAVKIGPMEIVHILLHKPEGMQYQIIYNVRLPRTIVAGLVGISLALSGAILQGIMRNPLAGPNIIGVSSGAGLVALVILMLYPSLYYFVPFGAFLGALATTLFIYALAWKDGVLPTRMILAGVAISSLLGAGINSLLTFYPDRVAGAIHFLVGGLSAVTWQDVLLVLPYSLFGIVLLLMISNKLNILMLGDEVATGLGLNVERTRFLFIALSSLLAGSAVSAVGLLGFVGLIVPHIARLFVGSDYRYLFPGSILLGAGVLILCDTLARTMFAPIEIPVGIIMSALGGPFFLHLLRKREVKH